MKRDVMWQRMNAPGLEHLRLASVPEGFLADGVLLTVLDDTPARATYQMRCDTAWRVRWVEVTLRRDTMQTLTLQSNGEGHWISAAGEPLPALQGCIDVDIFPTPFTNTLAIRRLALVLGESAELTVAFIELPSLSVQAVKQRYTCLEAGREDARYRYEGLETGFTTELWVDADGLVGDYPGWFRRVWP
jgi:hypothetical protein